MQAGERYSIWCGELASVYFLTIRKHCNIICQIHDYLLPIKKTDSNEKHHSA